MKYRVVEKATRGESKEIKLYWVIEQQAEVGWFKKTLIWVPLREKYYGYEYQPYYKDIEFTTKAAAITYYDNLMIETPEDKVVYP